MPDFHCFFLDNESPPPCTYTEVSEEDAYYRYVEFSKNFLNTELWPEDIHNEYSFVILNTKTYEHSAYTLTRDWCVTSYS